MVSRCFPGGYNVKLYISRGRLARWLLAFLCCVKTSSAHIRQWANSKLICLVHLHPGWPSEIQCNPFVHYVAYVLCGGMWHLYGCYSAHVACVHSAWPQPVCIWARIGVNHFVCYLYTWLHYLHLLYMEIWSWVRCVSQGVYLVSVLWSQ